MHPTVTQLTPSPEIGRPCRRLALAWGHNCTGGEWSRLRMSIQGKRAEDGWDDLGNHAQQTNKRRFQSARLRSRCLSSESRLSARECLRPGAWHQLEGST